MYFVWFSKMNLIKFCYQKAQIKKELFRSLEKKHVLFAYKSKFISFYYLSLLSKIDSIKSNN